jgi:cytochrome c oxidase cbb3-type subunit 3
MISFWLSGLFIVGYAILYPFWPMVNDYTRGIMGWSQIGEYREGVDEVEKVRAQYEEKIKGMSAAQILADEGLSRYTVASAKVLFGDYCGACHGAGGQGGPGYPVIIDDDWLYGGSVDVIIATITNGRKGMMPAQGKLLSEAEIDTLADAIVGGTVTKEPLFIQKACMACHGMDGKGMQVLGAVNLIDAIWRFDEADRLASAKYTITHGVNDASDPMSRDAEMPKFGDRLSADEIKKLAVYVVKLGGGQ